MDLFGQNARLAAKHLRKSSDPSNLNIKTRKTKRKHGRKLLGKKARLAAKQLRLTMKKSSYSRNLFGKNARLAAKHLRKTSDPSNLNIENKKRTWEEIVRQEGFAGSRTVEAYNEKVKLFEEFGRQFEEERKEWEKTRSRLFEEFKEDVKEWQKAYLSCGFVRPKCTVGSQTFEEVKRSEQLKHQNKENKKKTWEEIVGQEGPAGSQTVEAYNEKVKLFEEFSHQNKENFKKWEQRYSRDGVEVPEKFAWQECTEEGCFNPKPEKFLIPKPEKFLTPKHEEFVWQDCTVGRATCEDCIEKVKCLNHQVEQLEQELEIVNRRKKRCLRDEVEVPEKLSRLAAAGGIRNIIPTEHKRVK
ncbi:uncharacterized protein LOC132316255 [Cornus florida]|uniref:uncharacterized protein LOC132316255 n=1 Tax=Cornus florida TaxID=4283 RepID=UPI00289CD956|nr:uncharacterized protein LOC132316255 [Cornus florida]